jgi:hypothetical protein
MSHLPEGSLPDQYVLCSKLWQQAMAISLESVVRRYRSPRTSRYCFFKGELIVAVKNKILLVTSTCLNQKSNLCKLKKQGTLA